MFQERVLNTDTVEYVIASSFASGKGRIFEIFFGWRGVRGEEARFVFSSRDWKRIDEMTAYYYTYVERFYQKIRRREQDK